MPAKPIHILTIIGARPQFIKAAMVSSAILAANHKAGREFLHENIIHTGQHYDENMSQVFFDQMGIPKPAFQLELGGNTHGRMTGRMLEAIETILLEEKPDAVLVYGDTNSTLAGALAASKLHIPVAHVEAGLRSFNRQMPEEINRVLTDHVSEWLFCPTTVAVNNLENEGITQGVQHVGDVMYDAALLFAQQAKKQSTILAELNLHEKDFFLATVHRQENTDHPERLEAILAAFQELAAQKPVVWPVHPRLKNLLENKDIHPGIRMIPPVSFIDMVQLEMNAKVILTDSGGVQKEAYFHGTPCVTLREESEWVETIGAGWNQLAGANPVRILDAVSNARPGQLITEYGKGDSANLIVSMLAHTLNH